MKTTKHPKTSAIVIDGKRIEATPERVDIDEVRLDSDNPRIRFLVKSQGKKDPTQDDLKRLLWDVSGVGELMRKIRDNKGAIDPILITEDGTVIEGNCRLACYRHLRPKDAYWQTIEAQRLPKITQREIDILLSKYHVSGKISWRSYAQAGQIYKLHHEHKMSIQDITRVTGIPEKAVKDLLKTYEIMSEEILPKVPGVKGLKKFSYVYEFVKNPDLHTWRSDAKNVKEFVGWVVDGKLKKGDQVRELPQIVKTPAALKTLRVEKDGGKKAFGMVVRPTEFASLEKALQTLGALNSALIERLKSDKKEQKVMKQLYAKLKDVATLAEVDLD